MKSMREKSFIFGIATLMGVALTFSFPLFSKEKKPIPMTNLTGPSLLMKELHQQNKVGALNADQKKRSKFDQSNSVAKKSAQVIQRLQKKSGKAQKRDDVRSYEFQPIPDVYETFTAYKDGIVNGDGQSLEPIYLDSSVIAFKDARLDAPYTSYSFHGLILRKNLQGRLLTRECYLYDRKHHKIKKMPSGSRVYVIRKNRYYAEVLY